MLNITRQEAHLWCIDLNSFAAQVNFYKTYLSSDEIARAERLHFREHQQRFCLARGMLRRLLSLYLNCAAEKMTFTYNAYGKPLLPDTHLQFNLSHSGNQLIVAITCEHRIGIDIEHSKPLREFDQIAQRFFTAEEAAVIQQSQGFAKQQAFYQLWTAKEAILKALGLGLSYELKSIRLNLIDKNVLIVGWDDPKEATVNWTLNSFMPAKNYCAALAVDAHLREVKYRRIEK